MAYRATCHYYKSLIEYPLIWTGDARRVHALGVEIHGRELIDAALAHGKGLVVAALHLGSFEAAVIPMTAHYPFTGMYNPVKNGELDQISRQGRTRFGGRLVGIGTRSETRRGGKRGGK